MRAIKTATRPERNLKTLGSCTMINGMIDITMIFAAWLVCESVVIPDASKIKEIT